MKPSPYWHIHLNSEQRKAAKDVLEEGESLSSFVEHAIRAHINYRRNRREFIDQGLVFLAELERTGEEYTVEHVVNDLDGILEQAENKQRPQEQNGQ